MEKGAFPLHLTWLQLRQGQGGEFWLHREAELRIPHGLPLREGQPELGSWKEDRSKAREKRGSWDQSNTYLLTSKKFPIRHSTEGTVEAMEM